MKGTLLLVVLLGVASVPSRMSGQIVDTAVCNILRNPMSFDGKIVRLEGTVIAGFDEFVIKGTACSLPVDAIWLAYPEGTDAKAGPVANVRLQLGNNISAVAAHVTRTPVTLAKNSDFKTFDKFLSVPAKGGGLCLGCVKYAVTATLVGRLDGAGSTGFLRESQGRVVGLSGFGNLNQYAARLVLQSVSDVKPQEVDYSTGGIPVSAIPAPSAGAFTPQPPTADQVKRAVDAFGAQGEDNGVNVSFGIANEVAKNEDGKSDAASPDGLIFDVTFDGNRLKGAAMQVALTHVGTHIADLRSTASAIQTLPLYGSEFRAWQTSILSAATANLRSLTLSGGYTIYDRSWPDSNLGKNAYRGISAYLVSWVGLENLPKH